MSNRYIIDAALMGGAHERGMARFANALVRNYGEEIVEIRPPQMSRFYQIFPLWEQIGLRAMIKAMSPRVAIFPYNTGPIFFKRSTTLTVLVVHDLIFLTEGIFSGGTAFQVVGRLYRKAVVPWVVRNASLIVTVSEYSASRLRLRFGLPEDRIFVLPNTFLNRFGRTPVRQRVAGLVVTVSGEAPSKNLDRLICAFASTLELVPHARLVVAGLSSRGISLFGRKYRELVKSAAVTLLERVSDDKLADWYSSCALYICASIEEGFGIPVLEAMACAAPVAVSDRSSLPEICADAAVYFDPEDSVDIARVITLELLDPGRGKQRVPRGLQRVKVYSREAFAARCRELHRQVEAMIHD